MKVISLADRTVRFLEQLIITDELKPGQQIKEDDIATKLDISRPPVREAFKTLEGQGLVIRKPRKGTFVVKMMEKDIREVYILKAELYALATELAMDKIIQQEKDALGLLVNKMRQIVDDEPCNILAYQKIHSKFHNSIMEIAGNGRLLNFASNLHKQIRRFSYQTLHYKEHLKDSSAFHFKIMESIMSDDRTNAAQLMKAHVLDAMNFLLENPNIFTMDKDQLLA